VAVIDLSYQKLFICTAGRQDILWLIKLSS